MKGTVIGAAASAPVKGTVVGPASGAPVNGTVIGSAADTPVNGTVIGPASSQNSANPYSSSNPYGIQDGCKKGIWVGIAVVAILDGAGAYLLFGPDSADEPQTEVAVDPAVQKMQEEKAEFDAAMALFNHDSPDSIKVALNRMKVLADNGYKDAIYQVAYTYAMIQNDTESDRRKRLLGWQTIEKGEKKGTPVSEEINREAISWLEKAIDVKVDNYHQCLYWLTFYYYLGVGTEEDNEKAWDLLMQAKDEAGRKQDFVYKEKIEKTINGFE